MKRSSRETSIFNMSALDLLATATGTFVLIVVILLPYYRKDFHAHAEIADVRASTDDQSAEAEEILRAAVAEGRAAQQVKAEAEQIMKAAAEAKAAATSLRQEADLIDGEAGDDEERVAELKATVQTQVIKELDLIFVVDTTASMTQVLEDLRFSIGGMIRILERLVPSLRIGIVAYRDHDLGTRVTQTLQPARTDTQAGRIFRFVNALRPAPRGGPTPREAVYTALNRALNMPLRRQAKQTVILMGDAGPHHHRESATLILAQSFKRSGPKRTLSTLFVETRSYLLFGDGDKEYYKRLARAGGGEFSEHEGSMIENVLLAVLSE